MQNYLFKAGVALSKSLWSEQNSMKIGNFWKSFEKEWPNKIINIQTHIHINEQTNKHLNTDKHTNKPNKPVAEAAVFHPNYYCNILLWYHPGIHRSDYQPFAGWIYSTWAWWDWREAVCCPQLGHGTSGLSRIGTLVLIHIFYTAI